MTARFLLPAALAIALQLYPACAATLTENDFNQAEALQTQLLQLTQDVLDVARATNGRDSYECLNDMYTNLLSVSDSLTDIIDFIDISTDMKAPADERIVNFKLARNLGGVRSLLANSRRGINLSAGQCGRDRNVTDKAREALGIFSRLDGFYGTLQSKLGATQR